MEYGTLYLCEFRATVEIADHNITQCSTHKAPEEISGLMILDDETRCWLYTLAAASDLGSLAAYRVVKKMDPRPWTCSNCR